MLKEKNDKLLKEIFDIQDNIQDIKLNKSKRYPIYYALNKIGGKRKIAYPRRNTYLAVSL